MQVFMQFHGLWYTLLKYTCVLKVLHPGCFLLYYICNPKATLNIVVMLVGVKGVIDTIVSILLINKAKMCVIAV